ncbi:hypothetical protein F5Y14DRAFT_446339 [Nemania sp. NC0429]|nr:hypothetical protein F5Y14DRAFT_446339 [Nemania sp. NC0429]
MEEAVRRSVLAQPALETPDGAEPNLANPPNMNSIANGILIAAVTLASLAILLRIHYWIFVLKRLRDRLEAVLVIIGFGSYVGLVYCLVRISQFEIGWWVHKWDMTVDSTIGFSYWVYIAGLLYTSAIAPVKVAILMEWMRIFPSCPRNTFFWFCSAALWLNVAYYIAAIVVQSMQCIPREMIWDPTVKGTCLSTRGPEAIAAIDVISDIAMLVAPQFVIWRSKVSTRKRAGFTVIFAVGLFGTISAIFRLVTTLAYLRSEDSTYAVSPVCFWALGEVTSVFIVYGLPAVSTVFAEATLGFSRCRTRWIQGSSAGHDSDASNVGPWRERRTALSKRYRNLDRNSLPANALDRTATTRCSSATAKDLRILPESTCVVVKTIEIRRDEVRADEFVGDIDKDIEEDVLIRQHPWVKPDR